MNGNNSDDSSLEWHVGLTTIEVSSNNTLNNTDNISSESNLVLPVVADSNQSNYTDTILDLNSRSTEGVAVINKLTNTVTSSELSLESTGEVSANNKITNTDNISSELNHSPKLEAAVNKKSSNSESISSDLNPGTTEEHAENNPLSNAESRPLEQNMESEQETVVLNCIPTGPIFKLPEEAAICNKLINRLYNNLIWNFEIECPRMLNIALYKVLEDVLVKIYESRTRFSYKLSIEEEKPVRFLEKIKKERFSLHDLMQAIKVNPHLLPNRQFYLTFREHVALRIKKNRMLLKRMRPELT